MDLQGILQIIGIGGVAVGILALLRRLGLLRGAGSAGKRLGQGLGRARDAARTRESEAHRKREAADDAAIEEIENRPHTDDPARDLADRLYGSGRGASGTGQRASGDRQDDAS